MSVIPSDDLYEDYAATFLGKPRIAKPAPDVDVTDLLDRMKGGALGQESGGNYQVKPNARTGAVGGFQVLPENIPSWTAKHYGKQLTPQEFQANPQAQDAVFNGQMGEYLREARKVAPDDDTAIRMGAAGWYGGPKALHRYDDDWRPKPDEPSFKEYTTGVLNKSGKRSSDLFESYSKAFGTHTPEKQPDDLFASYQAAIGQPKPVTEAPATIQAQIDSALDPKTPRAAVLTTDETQNGQMGQVSGFTAIQRPEGTLWVNNAKAKKLKLKSPQDIEMFLNANPDAMTRLIGKVENVGDTSQGKAVLTTLPDGVEASASIVTSPEAAQQQIGLDKANHPISTSQIVDAQDVVAKRQSDLGTPPTDVPGYAEQIIAPDAMPDDQYQYTPPPPFEMQNTKVPTVAKKGIVRKPKHGTQTDVQVSDVDLDENGVPLNQPKLSVVDAKNPDNAVAETYDVPKGLDATQAGEYINKQLQAKYGKDFKTFHFLSGYHPGNKVDVTYGDLKSAGVDIEPLIKEQVIKTRTETPTPDLRAVPYDFAKATADDVNANAQDIASVLNPLLRYAPEDWSKAIVGGTAGPLIALPGQLGGIAGGIIKAANEYSPSMNAIKSILDTKVANPHFDKSKPIDEKTNPEFVNKYDVRDPTEESLREFYDNSTEVMEKTGAFNADGKATIPTQMFRMVGSIPKIMIVSALPGGMIGGFALEGGAISKLHGGSNADVFKAAAKGATQGAIFKFLPKIVQNQLGEGASTVVRAGIEVPAIAIANYTVGSIAGDDAEDNLINSGAIALFHGYGLAKVKGKVAHVVDSKGNEAYLKAEGDKVVTVEPQTADIEMVLPKATTERAPQPAPSITGDAKPVDIFHGTTADAVKAIEKSGFDVSKAADGTIWFTTDKTKIENGEVSATGKGGIVERQIDESKLKLGGWDETDKYSTDELIAKGYDGLKLPDGENGEVTYQIFHPEKLGKTEAKGKSGQPKVSPDVEGKVSNTSEAVPPTQVDTPVEKPQTTSTKNAVVEAERIERKLSPIEKEAKREWGPVWDEAGKELEKNPDAAKDLIADLRTRKPKSDTENAILLHERIRAKGEYDAANQAVNEAFEGTPEQQIDARVRLAKASDDLLAVDEAAKRAGSESGRGLNARRMMANEDYTLAALETRKRAANGGRPLTDVERTTLEKTAKDYQSKSEALEATLKEREDDLAAMKNRAELAEAKKEQIRSRPSFDRAERIAKKLREDADAARERLKKRGAVFTAGLDPAALKDLAHIGASHLADAGLDFAKFSDRMISEFGDKIKPHLQDIYDRAKELGEKIRPGLTEAQRLQALKIRTEKRIAELTEKIETHNFSKKTRKPPPALDAKAKQLTLDVNRIKRKFEGELHKDRLNNRSRSERAQDFVANWARMSFLSWPTTLGKLASAAAQRAIYAPIEEAIGAGYSKAFKRLAKQSPSEAGFNIKAEARTYTKGLIDGMKDAYKQLKMQESDLNIEYGKREFAPPTGKVDAVMQYFGVLHGALKSPVKRMGFERSLYKRTEHAMQNGLDVSDPIVQMDLGLAAYKDANRQIFMQDNKMVTAYKSLIRTLEQPNKETGKPGPYAKAATTALKITFPVVKIPVNIAGEIVQYATGLASGSVKLAKAYRKGIENLPPDEADLIMRQLKKGTIGPALILLGYFNPNAIGGYYQPGQKRDDKDVKFGSIKVFGVNVPSLLLHNPATEMLQIGATIRRVSDSKFKKSDKETRGIMAGMIAATTGVAEEIPFVKQTIEAGKAFDPRSQGDFVGEFVKSRTIPGFSQYIANKTDVDAKGTTIKRKPDTSGLENLWQHLELGIPGLRQNVKKQKK